MAAGCSLLLGKQVGDRLVDQERDYGVNCHLGQIERQQDRQDVSMGVMRLEEYRAKWYGETVEQARKNLPEQNQVME